MEDNLARLVEDAEVHRFRVKIDTAVMGMLFGVESHGSLLNWGGVTPSLPSRWVGSGEAFISIKAMQRIGTQPTADHRSR